MIGCIQECVCESSIDVTYIHRVPSFYHMNVQCIRTRWWKVMFKNRSISIRRKVHPREGVRARHVLLRPWSCLVHGYVKSGEKEEAVCGTGYGLRGNANAGVRGGCEWERKEASVLDVLRGVDGKSSSYMVMVMVMVGLLMFNVDWVRFEIELLYRYECE